MNTPTIQNQMGDGQNVNVYDEDYDIENPLKTAFYALREIPDPNNKLESIKGELMDLIGDAQDGKWFDKGVF
jgi:hypothetical protein